MLVGDKSRFAAEWQERCRVNGRSFLHLRFWSQDRAIGDFEDDVMSAIITGYIREFIQQRKMREEYAVPSELDALSVYNALYASFYDGEDGWQTKVRDIIGDASLDLRAVFHLTDIGGTCFDSVGVMACSTAQGEQVLIWKEHQCEEVRETRLPLGYIEKVFEEFLGALGE